MLKFGVITLFPEMFSALSYGVVGRALSEALATVECFNPRDWTTNPSRQIDDKPYGGGPGMVMQYTPLKRAIYHAKKMISHEAKVIYLSPQGKVVSQTKLTALSKAAEPIIFVAGRYEGIDERVITHHVDEEWSIGDFVLSGGELAAMVYIDAMIRLLPASLGDARSAEEDSFMRGILDYPHYTRPAVVDDTRTVPPVLLKGNHRDIRAWRRKMALGNTWLKRPDLLAKIILTEEDETLLLAFQKEFASITSKT